MIINGAALVAVRPVEPMPLIKQRSHGVSWGLTEAGIDVRLDQNVTLHPLRRFVLASTLERFDMPDDLCGFVMGKSTWARRGVNVQATLIEPGWRGHLTLEIHLQSNRLIRIPRGAGIAAVLFAQLAEGAIYSGHYQDQARGPVAAITG